MFDHHKYCVVEITGRLFAYEDERGLLSVFVVDTNHRDKDGVQGAAFADGVAAKTALDGYEGEKIKITDPSLIDYILQHATLSKDGFYRYILDVRMTSTVSIDGNEVQFSDVSDAIIKDNNTVLRYQTSAPKA